jgi:hypothetical protein
VRKGGEDVRKQDIMNDRERILMTLKDVIGEEGCGVSCEQAEVFRDEEGWKFLLEGFMEPWPLGKTVEEAEARIKEYASQGFGMA